MTFNDWFWEEGWNTTIENKEDLERYSKRLWDAAIEAALDELETHWYSKDKAQRSVQDLLTQD